MAWPWSRATPWPGPPGRPLLQAAAALAVVLSLAGAVVVAALAANSLRPAAMLLAAMLMVMGAIGSGNPRLFCLWGLMVVLPFDLSMYLSPFSSKGGGERAFRIEAADLFWGALLLFQLRDLWCRRWPGLRVPKVIFVWLFIMLAWGLGTIALAPYRSTAAHEMVRMLKMALLFVVIVNELDSTSRLRHAVAALVLGMFVQSGVGLMQYALGRTLGLGFLGELSAQTVDELATTSVRGARVFRISAFVGHPNLLGVYLAASLPLTLAALLTARRSWARVAYGLAGIAALVALILTQSRSGWLSFAVALVLLLALMVAHRGLFRRSITTVALATLTAVLVFGAFQEQISRRLFDSLDQAATGREEFKEDARRLIDDHYLLGAGLNQYTLALPPYMKIPARSYSYWIPPVHHIYYLWWAETGLIGLMLHLAFWAAIAWRALRNLRLRDEMLFLVNAACLAAMAAFAVDGFLSFSLRVNQPQRLYFVLAALIYALHYLRQAELRALVTRDSRGAGP